MPGAYMSNGMSLEDERRYLIMMDRRRGRNGKGPTDRGMTDTYFCPVCGEGYPRYLDAVKHQCNPRTLHGYESTHVAAFRGHSHEDAGESQRYTNRYRLDRQLGAGFWHLWGQDDQKNYKPDTTTTYDRSRERLRRVDMPMKETKQKGVVTRHGVTVELRWRPDNYTTRPDKGSPISPDSIWRYLYWCHRKGHIKSESTKSIYDKSWNYVVTRLHADYGVTWREIDKEVRWVLGKSKLLPEQQEAIAVAEAYTIYNHLDDITDDTPLKTLPAYTHRIGKEVKTYYTDLTVGQFKARYHDLMLVRRTGRITKAVITIWYGALTGVPQHMNATLSERSGQQVLFDDPVDNPTRLRRHQFRSDDEYRKAVREQIAQGLSNRSVEPDDLMGGVPGFMYVHNRIQPRLRHMTFATFLTKYDEYRQMCRDDKCNSAQVMIMWKEYGELAAETEDDAPYDHDGRPNRPLMGPAKMYKQTTYIRDAVNPRFLHPEIFYVLGQLRIHELCRAESTDTEDLIELCIENGIRGEEQLVDCATAMQHTEEHRRCKVLIETLRKLFMTPEAKLKRQAADHVKEALKKAHPREKPPKPVIKAPKAEEKPIAPKPRRIKESSDKPEPSKTTTAAAPAKLKRRESLWGRFMRWLGVR